MSALSFFFVPARRVANERQATTLYNFPLETTSHDIENGNVEDVFWFVQIVGVGVLGGK